MSKLLRDFLEDVETYNITSLLFTQIPDIVFCVKDLRGRYITVNRAFSNRLGCSSPNTIIGKTAEEVFPPTLAEIYTRQDALIYKTGEEMVDRLELINHYKQPMGWYLASKFPLHNKDGEIKGLISISRDLYTPSNKDLEFAGVLKAVTYVHKNYAENIEVSHLANISNLTVLQLERRIKKAFKLSISQLIKKTRIEFALKLLADGDNKISDIAQSCGYSDQSSFSRQFTQYVGVAPGVYRNSLN